MLKKSILAAVVFALLAIPVIADQEHEADAEWVRLKAHDWPVTFDWVATSLRIPVEMQVGLFIEFYHKDVKIALKQKNLREYAGCSQVIEMQSNFDFQMKGDMDLKANGVALQPDLGKWTVEIRDELCENVKDFVSKTLSAIKEKRTVWVQVKEAKVYELDYGKNVYLGDVVISVRPTFEFEWTDP